MITSYFAPKRRRTESSTSSNGGTTTTSTTKQRPTREDGDADGDDHPSKQNGKRRLQLKTNDNKQLSSPPLEHLDDDAVITVTPSSGAKSHTRGSGSTSSTTATTSSRSISNSSSQHVEQMLMHLHDHSSSVTTTEGESTVDASTCANGSTGSQISWKVALEKHFASKSFQSLSEFVASQRSKAPKTLGVSGSIYPPPNEVFSALNMLPLDKIKVVIVGQDPYHQYNQGHGLAFSVKRGVKIPPSLRNIYKELLNDSNVAEFRKIPLHGYLGRWSKQEGVLLLNAVLTVRHGEANSHAKKGWEEFTDAVIDAVVNYHKHRGVVFLLWGKPASKKAEAILQKHASSKHAVITSSHPSPLSASKTNQPFLTSQCFSRANKALKNMGLEPVNWKVD